MHQCYYNVKYTFLSYGSISILYRGTEIQEVLFDTSNIIIDSCFIDRIT